MKEIEKDYSEELIKILNKRPALLPRISNVIILLMILCIIILSNYITYPEYVEKDFYNMSQSGQKISGIIGYNSKEDRIIKIGQKVIFIKRSNNQIVGNGQLTGLKITSNNAILTVTKYNTNFDTEEDLKIKILITQKKLLDNIWF